MDRARFESLAEAYGGEVGAWPEAVRDAAAVLMLAEPETTRRILERARALDSVLDAWRPSPATAGLIDRIVASAPAAGPRWPSWISPAALAAGLAAASIAGLFAGVQLSDRAIVNGTAISAQVSSSATLNLEPALDLEGT